MKIDCRGENCPIPVIKTKKALRDAESNATLTVSVDNRIATENLEKMSNELGYKIEIEKIEDHHYEVTIIKGEGGKQEEVSKIENGIVIAIGNDKMGEGDETLGKTLIKGYIYSLVELDTKPEKIIFYNKGVNLTTEGSDSIQDLSELEKLGVKIYSCGACLNYYKLEDKLKVGQVTNMYYISDFFINAKTVIKP